MIKQSISIILCSFLFIGWHCANVDDPVSPQDARDELLYSVFESQQQPSMSGWSFSDSLAQQYISFSTDVPAPYQTYSLRLQGDSITHYVPEISIRKINKRPYPNKKYNVEYFGKGKGLISIEVKASGQTWYEEFEINNAAWGSSNKKVAACGNDTDTITIWVKPIISDSVSYLLIKNVVLSAYK